MDTRPTCKYGSKCYRKNSEHLEKFRHPSIEERPSKKPKIDHPKISNFFSKVGESSKKPVSVENKRVLNTSTKELSTSSSPDKNVNKEGSIEKEELNIKQRSPDKRKRTPSDISCIAVDYSLTDIERLFLVKMPIDFAKFYDFLKEYCPMNPSSSLHDVNIALAGPYDVLRGSFKPECAREAVLHDRYYFDPPEFQTILKEVKSKFHLGYFRDSPGEDPVFVASNNGTECSIRMHSPNVFASLNILINKYLESCDPFKKIKINKFKAALQSYCKRESITLAENSPKFKERKKKVMCDTFHGCGLVVPYDKKTDVGYRPLAETYAVLKGLLKNIAESTEDKRSFHWSKLQHVITFANIATDECDFGTGLELGLNMFCTGHEIFHPTIKQFMSTAYGLLGREEFSEIINYHLDERL